MRQKRAKTYRKLLRTYVQHFNFREPFQILLDDSFLLTLSKHKVTDPIKRITDLIQTEKDAKLMITQCSIVSLYKKEKEGSEFKDAVGLAKLAERRKCNHRDPIEVEDCIKSVVGTSNQHRYVLATESASIRHHLRNNVLGVPVLHHNDRGVMVMEPMSDLTQTRIDQLEHRKLSATKTEAQLLGTGNAFASENVIGGSSFTELDGNDLKVEPSSDNQIQSTFIKKKKAKEPNPLSMKKSKKQKEIENQLKEKEKKAKQLKKSKEIARSKGSDPNEFKKVREKRKREEDDSSARKEKSGDEHGNGEKSVEIKTTGIKKRRKRGKGGSGKSNGNGNGNQVESHSET